MRCERFDRWAQSSRAEALRRERTYAQLLASPSPAAQLRELLSDVERTCPGLTFFQISGGREMLTNILKAWVAYDAQGQLDRIAVGYVQGMSAIASHLLWHAGDEEEAFWVFAAMLQHCGLRSMFAPPDMHGLQMRIFIVSQLLMEAMPDLGQHLAEHLNNGLGLVLADWLVTLFAGYVPLDPLAMLWDRFFKEGYTAIYRLALARLRCLRPWLLLETEFGALARLIKSIHVDFHLSSGRPMPQLPQISAAADDESTGQAAWTCLACNGSESCGSWEVLVALIAEERIWSQRVMELEQMYNGTTSGESGARDVDAVACGADAGKERISSLEAENAQLRSELSLARSELAQALHELAQARTEIASLRSQA